MVTQSAPEIFHSRDSPFQFEWKERKGWALVGRMTGRLPLAGLTLEVEKPWIVPQIMPQ